MHSWHGAQVTDGSRCETSIIPAKSKLPASCSLLNTAANGSKLVPSTFASCSECISHYCITSAPTERLTMEVDYSRKIANRCCRLQTICLCAPSRFSSSEGKQLVNTNGTNTVPSYGRVIEVENGVPLLAKITATGCSVTALAAAFIAAAPTDALVATASALSIFG